MLGPREKPESDMRPRLRLSVLIRNGTLCCMQSLTGIPNLVEEGNSMQQAETLDGQGPPGASHGRQYCNREKPYITMSCLGYQSEEIQQRKVNGDHVQNSLSKHANT